MKKMLFLSAIGFSFLLSAAGFVNVEKTTGVTPGNVYRQDGDEFITRPQNIVWYKGSVYVLGAKVSRILVFKDHRYRFAIGRPGQGPGELMMPRNFFISDDVIYVRSDLNKIDKFSLNGTSLGSIRLHITNGDISLTITDFIVADGKFYVSFGTGNTKVGCFGMDGTFIGNHIQKDSPKTGKGKIVNAYRLFVHGDKLMVFDVFTSSYEEYDRRSGKLLCFIEALDEHIREESEKMTEVFAKSNGFNTVRFCEAGFAADSGKMYVVPFARELPPRFFIVDTVNHTMTKWTMKLAANQNRFLFLTEGKGDLIFVDTEMDMAHFKPQGGF